MNFFTSLLSGPTLSTHFLEEAAFEEQNSVETIQILIVDDQNFVCKMLEHSLSSQSGLGIVGVATNGHEAIAQVKKYAPDIVLVDIEMPEMDGLTLIQKLVDHYPATKVIVLSIHDDESYIREALGKGARGYLLKNTPPDELAHAIRFVNRGYLQMGPGLFEKLEGSPTTLAVESIAAPTAIPSEIEPQDNGADEWTDVTQDLVNTMPQVWSRGLVYVALAFIAGAIPWSFLTKIDEVVVTQGILEPKGQTIRLDAPVEAKVVNLYVKEGSAVKQGDPIVEFQSDRVKAELQQSQSVLTGLMNQLAQQELLKNQIMASINAQTLQNEAQSVEKQAQVTQAEQLLDARQNRMPIQLSEKLAQVDQAIAALDAAQRKQALLNDNYQTELTELKRYQALLNNGAVSSVQVVEIQRRVNDVQRLTADADAEVALSQKRLQEQRRSYDNLKSQLIAEQQQAETQVIEQQGGKVTLKHSGNVALSQSREQLENTQTRMTELKAQIEKTQSLIQSLHRQQKQSTVYAPTDGTIFKLSFQHPGAVVRPSQPIAQIAPASAKLVLRGAVANKDVGFLETGLPVNLKFDAFPYENFGLIRGTVTWLSPNSTPITAQTGGGETEGLPPGQSSYTVEVSLEQDAVQSSDKTIKFRPGQTASAEIAVRQRRVIDLFLDPFLKYQKGNLSI